MARAFTPYSDTFVYAHTFIDPIVVRPDAVHAARRKGWFIPTELC